EPIGRRLLRITIRGTSPQKIKKHSDAASHYNSAKMMNRFNTNQRCDRLFEPSFRSHAIEIISKLCFQTEGEYNVKQKKFDFITVTYVVTSRPKIFVTIKK